MQPVNEIEFPEAAPEKSEEKYMKLMVPSILSLFLEKDRFPLYLPNGDLTKISKFSNGNPPYFEVPFICSDTLSSDNLAIILAGYREFDGTYI